jgi:hypothetical protein
MASDVFRRITLPILPNPLPNPVSSCPEDRLRPADGTALELAEEVSIGRSIRSELVPPRIPPHSLDDLRSSILALPAPRVDGEPGVMVRVDVALNEAVEDDCELWWYGSAILLFCLFERGVDGDEGRASCGAGGEVNGSSEVVRRGTKRVGLGARAEEGLRISPAEGIRIVQGEYGVTRCGRSRSVIEARPRGRKHTPPRSLSSSLLSLPPDSGALDNVVCGRRRGKSGRSVLTLR